MRSAQFTRGRGSGRRCCEPEAGDRRPATGDRRAATGERRPASGDRGDRRLTLQGNGARCRESYRESVCLLTGSRAQWNRNRMVPQFEKKPFVPLPS
jgi:hypothetical protein